MQNKCEQLHKIFNQFERFKYPFDINKIPENGIYILFEKGEKAHGGLDRIVRIGSHTGQNQLGSRLLQHFVNENKDRSIFRKNIGRCILNKNHDNFIVDWNKDLTSRKNKIIYSKNTDYKKLKEIEKEITIYLRNNFSFVIISIDDRDRRLEIEKELIATIAQCNECGASDNWFGKYSTKDKIKNSGLWQEQHLFNTPITNINIEFINN